MKQLSFIKAITIVPGHLWIIFLAVFVIFAIMTAILHYHWWRYRRGNGGVIIAEIIYLTVSALLIVGAVIALVTP